VACSFLSSGSSGGVCAMGDPERPEAARPEQDEVNVASSSAQGLARHFNGKSRRRPAGPL
jgi:hypothetical protein